MSAYTVRMDLTLFERDVKNVKIKLDAHFSQTYSKVDENSFKLPPTSVPFSNQRTLSLAFS